VSPVWHNHSDTQSCSPREIVHPRSLEELIGLVQRAEQEQTTVRAVGAGHSWSDVALTEGYLIEPDNLGSVTRIDDQHVRVGGGTHLRSLNARLDDMGFALKNMGGYDAQTLAGVISTSTHGSGLRWGPFPDMVRSMDVVVAGGRALRLEPNTAPFTNADGFDEPPLELVHDDSKFWAAVCGMGTLGLIHSVVIEVREKFWLEEKRTLSTWEQVRDTLTPSGVLGEGDHYELFLNPYPLKGGRHRLLVTRRHDTPEPTGPPETRIGRHPLTEIEASLPPVWWSFRFLARHWPRLLAYGFNHVLQEMCDESYKAVSYDVFNIGEANHLPAYSMELGVPLDGDRHIEAVNRILQIAKERRRKGIVHTSPLSLRFVAPSQALVSMMHEQPTMMIELILVTGTHRGDELLAGYEEALADLGARPHWGQFNLLTEASVGALYPTTWQRWVAVAREFNSSGVFDSQFTRRVGLS
jgi:hypothetical protein